MSYEVFYSSEDIEDAGCIFYKNSEKRGVSVLDITNPFESEQA